MKKTFLIHNPFFRLIAPINYGVFVYLLVLLVNNNLGQLNEIFIGQEVYICIGLSFLSFESIRLIILLLDKYLPTKWQSVSIPVQFILSTTVSLVLVIGSLVAYFTYIVGFSIATTQLLIFSVIFLITGLLYNLLYFSNYYLNQENTIKLAAEEHQQEVLEMEISEFKNDINPDLLYESLENTIGLIYQDKDKAEEYIDCLAATYRYTLTQRHKEFVSVTSEVQAAQNIIQLLNEKYYQQLRFDVHPEALDKNLMLIPGSLPIAIENIVRNTIITQNDPLIITCYLEDDEYLILQSKLNDRLLLHDDSIQAFKRLQKSYALYCEKPMIQVKAYVENYVKFPVVTMEEEILPH
ncbi:MAG: histidine kinase [Cyclobacteriaceae bacterium]|nr:histidine kinase [Cyclobacteriaceae bacterium]